MEKEKIDFFWKAAEPLLKKEGISQGTMMGFPCLRVEGAFFASADFRTGDLVTKLPRERVEELIESQIGGAFAPAGRKFKEWVVITDRDPALWSRLMDESLEFVAGS